jgi:(2R)-sulfolactate sulfo-lyase subunit alpha
MHKALAHNRGDHVAVAVAPIAAGEEITIAHLDDDSEQTLDARSDVPYGHKIALTALDEGAVVIEYGTQVAVTRAPIEAGAHVHTHNVKTARW